MLLLHMVVATLVSLVCDGFIVDQILCVNPLPIVPAKIEET